MYFLDPRLGRRRRALARDQVVRVRHKAADGLDAAMRDLSNRWEGTLAEARTLISSEPVSDEVLVRRIRSKLGRYVSHPHAVQVDAVDGHVTLRGAILKDEAETLIRVIGWLHGVKSVHNQLDIHETAGRVSDLQGEGRTPGAAPDLLQSNWTPGTRLIAGATGTVLMANCLLQRSLTSILLGTVGFGLVTRALSNLDTGRAFGLAGGRRGIDLEKTMEINAPREKVFDFFVEPENYLQISDMVTRVQRLGHNRFAKEMTVAGGLHVRFEERITRCDPPELIESESEPGSMLQYEKRARFERLAENRTRVDIHFSYNPPGGVLSHAAAAALGYDPKTLIDDLMVRAKNYLETGKQPHDATARREGQASSHSGDEKPLQPATAGVGTAASAGATAPSAAGIGYASPAPTSGTRLPAAAGSDKEPARPAPAAKAQTQTGRREHQPPR
jgi:uncharacterized membrane protein